MKARGLDPKNAGHVAQAKKAAVSEAYAKYDVPELRNMNDDELVAIHKLGGAKGMKASEQLIKNGSSHKIGNPQEVSNTIKEGEIKYGSIIRKEATKSMPSLARYGDGVQQRMNVINPTTGTVPSQAEAEEAEVTDVWKGLSTNQLRDIKAPNITAHALTRGIDSTKEAVKQMNASQRAQYTQMCTAGTSEYAAARILRNQLRSMGMTKEADNIDTHLNDAQMRTL